MNKIFMGNISQRFLPAQTCWNGDKLAGDPPRGAANVRFG